MRLKPEHLDALIAMSLHTACDDFVDLYGPQTGDRLWRKYQEKYDGNFLQFCRFLDSGNFQRTAEYANTFMDDMDKDNMDLHNKEQAEMHAVKPTPRTLKNLLIKHGNDLLNWPAKYRMWLVSDSDAQRHIREHAPGLTTDLAVAVGEWHQMSFLDLVEKDGSADKIPF